MNQVYEELVLHTVPGAAPGTVRLAFDDDPATRHVSIAAGRVGTWKITFTVGEGGISVGGGVALWWPHGGFRFSRRSQAVFPERRGYVTAETSGAAEVELHVNSRDPQHTHALASAVVREHTLEAGDEIVFRFNDRSAGAPGEMVYPNVTAMALHVGLDADGAGVFHELADSPLTINIVAGSEPARYLVLAPTSVEAGAGHSVRIVALDRCGNLAPTTAADLELRAPSCTGLPKRSFLSPLDGGRHTFEGVDFEAGVHRIKVFDRQRDLCNASNPIVSEPDPEYQVYWGDLHNHCYDDSLWLDLNATTDPDYNYRYGRDVSKLDFCALNFHLYLENGFNEQDQAWRRLQEAAARYHEPGRYVTFSGFETHGFGGDRCMILNTDLAPELDLRDLYGTNTRRHLESAADLERMFEAAAELGAMVTCHVGGTPANLDFHDARVQWSIEVASMHGNFEWFGQRAVRRGLRVGFHGSSDGHVQTPGHPRRPGSGGRNGDLNRRDYGYGSGALMGVWARELTREALWEAFRARRTYATTGARIWLRFTVNSWEMGGEARVQGPPLIHARVIGTATIERLALIRDDRLLHTWEIEADQGEVSFSDEGCPTGEHSYYLRVTQKDGELAWSSPVWVERTDGSEGNGSTAPPWNQDPSQLPIALSSQEAQRYERRLWGYLEREEDASRWDAIQAVRVVPSPMGRYALLLGYDRKREHRVHFKLFLDYPDVVMRIDLGWGDYGQYRNPGVEAFEDYRDGPREIR